MTPPLPLSPEQSVSHRSLAVAEESYSPFFFSRSTEADLITDVLDIAAAALGWIEGGLSKESALSVAGFAGSAAALSLYILNN